MAENSINPNSPTMPNPAANAPVLQDNGAKKVCPYCNSVIPAQAMYCPNCAQSLSPTVQSVKKKGKGGKIAIAIISVLLVIALGLGGGAWYIVNSAEKAYKTVTDDIDAGDFDGAAAAYGELNFYGEKKYKDEIAAKFKEVVKGNTYFKLGDDCRFVNTEQIEVYKSYKAFIDAANITDSGDSNAVEYVNAIVDLGEYSKYDSICKIWEETTILRATVDKNMEIFFDEYDRLDAIDQYLDDYTRDYMLDEVFSYSDYVAEVLGEIYDIVSKYDQDDELVGEYAEILKIMKDSFAAMRTGGKVGEFGDRFDLLVKNYKEAEANCNNALKKLPTLK